MKISNRLKLIASFVDDEANIIDVGCDHALLDIFLAQTKSNLKIIASDINKGPLESAKKNIKQYHLEDKIETKLGDGITTISKDTDTIIISGLGGETIIDILQDKDKLKNIKTIILSPHSAIYEVRQYLTNNNFKIQDEIFTYDQKKAYVIIKFVRGQETYSDEELFFGPIILKNKNNYFYDYYKELNEKNRKVLESIPKENQSLRNEIKKEIERLDKVLNV